MDALDAIRRRRSVRRYTDRPVSDADLDRILRLALLAPTGHNAQAWSFVVVREPELRRDRRQRGAPHEAEARGAHQRTAILDHAVACGGDVEGREHARPPP